MTHRNALVVFYTRTGHARALAEGIGRAIGADLEELRDRAARSGPLGWLRSALEASLGVSTELEPPRHDPARYDVVIVGGPVWASSVSTPVRTWLWLHRDRLPAVAWFASYGGIGAERAFGQMGELARKRPVATASFREIETAAGLPRERIKAFVAEVERNLRRRRPRRAARAAA